MMNRTRQYVQNALIGATAVVFAGAHLMPSTQRQGPVLAAAVNFVAPTDSTVHSTSTSALGTVAAATTTALGALANAVRPLSHPRALENAFRGYFAFKTAHPDQVKKPYLYFVDYGLPSTTPRGYVFDMDAMKIVDGPFTVAHGRGSAASQFGVPTRFSNAPGSQATSLG